MDMEKYKALFIEESREHLSDLSRLLVQIESTSEPVPIIEEIFRRFHSIKGMAASMGFDPIASLAHKMEDVASHGRAEKRAFERSIVDLLLRGVDGLAQQVEAVANDQAIPAHSELLTELNNAGAQVPMLAKKSTAAGSESTVTVARVPSEGATRNHLSIDVLIDDACKTPAVRLFMVHRRLETLGRVVDSTPSMEEIRGGQVGGHARFTVEAMATDDELRAAVLEVGEVAAVTVGTVVANAEPAPESATTEPVAEAKRSTTVRVRTDILDTLIDNVGELFILRERLESLLSDQPRPELHTTLDALGKTIREIRGQVMAVRMTPMRNLTDRYPRLVRDLAHSLSKEAELEIEGSEIELDRAILENLDEPFVHTLRNALDHGIESAQEREAAGKPPIAKVRISATRDRDTVVVIIEDDGRGLNPDVLRERAVRLGLVSEAQAEAMSSRDCYFLICLPSFSTKAEVSDLSGRGVGMDAVRAKIEAIGGTLDIESTFGSGTRFLFRLPLTVAIINVLLVESCGRLFALPVAKVVAVRETGDDTIQEAGGNTYLSFRHALAPIFNLGTLLGLRATHPPEQAVLMEDGRDLAAVAVDRVVGYHEVVVKPLGDPLDRMDWFSGATILGDGEPILILDIPKALRSRWAA